MNDKKKKKKLAIVVGAVVGTMALIGGTTAGVLLGTKKFNNRSDNSVAQRKDSLEDILNDKSLNIPSELRAYLSSMSSEEIENQVDKNKLKNTLVNWTVIQKTSNEFSNNKPTPKHLKFIEDALELNLANSQTSKSQLEKSINKNDKEAFLHLMDKSNEVKALENDFSNLKKYLNQTKNDFANIEKLLNKNESIFSVEGKKLINQKLIDDFKVSKNLNINYKKLIDLDQKATELLEAIKPIKAKQNKNEKEQAIVDKFNIIFNSQNILKDNKVLEDDTTQEISSLIDEINNQSSSSNDNQINEAKQNAKAYINSLSNLSSSLKSKYIQEVDKNNIESSINALKSRAKLYDDVAIKIISAIAKANELKSTQKYINATNKQEFDNKLAQIQTLLESNKLRANEAYIKNNSNIENIKQDLEDLETLSSELNGQEPSDDIERFKQDVESKLTSSISERAKAYSLENLLYSTMITKENKELFIDENKVDGVELTFKDVFVSPNNINELNVVYKAQSKTNTGLVTDVVEKVVFRKDFNEKLRSLSFNNLDELFDFNYQSFNEYFASELSTKKEEIITLFKKKIPNINGFFSFEVNKVELFYENNKLGFNVDFYFNSKKVKTLKLLTAQNVEFNDEFWKGITFDFSDEFKQSSYYQNPNSIFYDAEAMKVWTKQATAFNTWFTLNVFNPAKQTFANLSSKELDSVVNLVNPTSSSKQNALSADEVKQIMGKVKENLHTKLFNIRANGATYRLVDFDSEHIFDSQRTSTNQAKFKFMVTKNGQTKEKIVTVYTKQENPNEQDIKDLKYLRDLIETSTKEDASGILKLIKVKNPSQTHNQVNSKDAVEAFNTLYELPKKGKFEIYAHSLAEHTNIVNSNVGGTAKIRFWIKENGTPLDESNNQYGFIFGINRNGAYTFTSTSLGSFAKTIQYFKPLTYRDLKPANQSEWFKSSDFTESTTKIDNAHKNLINSINSTNFEYRRVDGSIVRNANKNFAVVDVQDIIDQKAFESLNLVLKLKAAPQEPERGNGNFTNEAPGKTNDDQPINSNVSSTTFYASNDNIAKQGDRANTSELKPIVDNYFMYFYDVKSTASNSITFKLGFINKNNNAIRYTNNKEITLVNLRNDYKENLYPEVILNRLKLSDITISGHSNITANDFINKVKSNDQQISSMISFKESSLTYNNFKFDETKIKIEEAKRVEVENGQYSVYVKLSYTSPVTSRKAIGNIWYKLTGFARSNETNDVLNFSNESLKTVFNSTNSITRERQIEPYYKDLLWTFDEETSKAKWLFKEKYIQKTLLSNNASNRKLKVRLYGNLLIQDVNRLKRISDSDKNYLFEIDFEQLSRGQEIVITKQTNEYYIEGSHNKYPRPTMIFKARYISGEGVHFSLELEEKEYKLFLGNPYVESITARELSGPRYSEFKVDKAFLLNYAGAHVDVVYTNNVEHEDFGQRTNEFNYKHLDYNQENQPITFYTPEEVINSDIYNPNQNVSYELHNGYLQDQEYMHASWRNIDLVNNIRNRSFAFSQGTATQFGKVSKSSDNTKHYIITNNHVEHIGRFSELQGENVVKPQTRGYLTKTSNNFGNDIDAGFSYWGGLNTANSIPIEVLWSGVDQINKEGQQSSGLTVDITVFAVDTKDLIKKAKEVGKFDLALWFENWSKLDNTTLDFSGVQKGVYFGPNVKKFGMSGFPYGKQSGYYLNRASSSTTAIGLTRQNGYAPTYYNAGNSGTGILGNDNEYISTINSGAPKTFLQSWNNENASYNYFGINYDNENPLDLKNTNSLAAQIIKWHLLKPLEVDMPWYFKDIKK